LRPRVDFEAPAAARAKLQRSQLKSPDLSPNSQQTVIESGSTRPSI
jgi:hypothetical protein